MRALLLFHFRVGVRIAAQSFAPLFCGILALIMLNVNPAAMVVGLAMAVYAHQPSLLMLAVLAMLALFMSFRAAPRITQGLGGWLRHLPARGSTNRRMTAVALLVSQAPLAISLAILALVAVGQGTDHLWTGLIRVALVMASAAMAAMPVRRQYLAAPLSVSALAMAFGPLFLVPVSLLALALADLVSGPLRKVRRRSDFWSVPGSLVNFWIVWRALRWRLLLPYVAASMVLVGILVFVENNAPPPPIMAGATVFGASFAVALLFSRLAQKIAVRRPAWHFARSLPWSSSSRIVADAVLMASHAIPILVLIVIVDSRVLLTVLAILPYLALRIAGYIRIIPENRIAAGIFLLEGFVVSGFLALIPWSSLLWLAGSVPAFFAARARERNQRVSRWHELHHTSAGDTLIWSK